MSRVGERRFEDDFQERSPSQISSALRLLNVAQSGKERDQNKLKKMPVTKTKKNYVSNRETSEEHGCKDKSPRIKRVKIHA